MESEKRNPDSQTQCGLLTSRVGINSYKSKDRIEVMGAIVGPVFYLLSSMNKHLWFMVDA